MNQPHQSQSAHAVFEVLVHDHADMLECYLRAVLPRGSSIDDLFQETMMVAWRRLADYDRSRPFAAWLRGIARTLVMEHARKGMRRPVTMDPVVLAAIDERFDMLAQAPGDSFGERAGRLVQCLAKLPQAMREAIDAVYARGLSLAVAAQVLNDNPEALKKRVQRGRRLLAVCMNIGDEQA